MVVIAFYSDVLVSEFIYAGNSWVEKQFRKLQWLSVDLHLSLIHVIEVEVTIPSGPNELAGL
jgi:hypothetical protein